MTKKEVKAVLSGILPFNRISGRKLSILIEKGRVLGVEHDEIIYRQNDPADSLFVLLRGRAAVLSGEDKETVIEIIKRGMCFGLISLLTDEPHSVTVRSIERSYIFSVDKDVFRDFLEKEPRLAFEFSRMLSQRVKARYKPKIIFQSKKIAVCGKNRMNNADYVRGLTESLKNETGKKCAGVFLHGFSPNSPLKEGVLDLNILSDDQLESQANLGNSGYFSVSYSNPDRMRAFLNFLGESYHFIVYEINYDILSGPGFDLLVLMAHQTHLLSGQDKEGISWLNKTLKLIRDKGRLDEEKVKLIVFGSSELSLAASGFREQGIQEAGFSIYANIPEACDESYPKALRRIGREAGGVTVGLALGSGAAYGFCHIGVLGVLQQHNIPVDVVCGSSMGAIVGALWALGIHTNEIKDKAFLLGKELARFSFPGARLPVKGLIAARRLEAIFKSVLGNLTFRDLKSSLRVVAFDFTGRKSAVIKYGYLYKALAATCAFPGIFEPVSTENGFFLDGGILNPLPTRVLFESSVNRIIASNISLSCAQAQRHYGAKSGLHIFDFIFGSIESMQQEFIQESLKMADVVIHPSLEGMGWTEFGRIDEFVAKGMAAAMEKLDLIKELAGV